MELTTIVSSVVGTVVAALAGWVLQRLGSKLGLDKNSALLDEAEKWIEKGINRYEPKLADIIEKKVDEATGKNEVVNSVLSFVNKNAPKIMKKANISEEQLNDWVEAQVEKRLSSKK